MEKGRVYHSSLFLLRVYKTDELKSVPPKISAVVPNKVLKTAVKRNYLRRKMYEAVQKIYPEIRTGMHIIVFSKNTAATISFEQLCIGMKEIFVKAGLLR